MDENANEKKAEDLEKKLEDCKKTSQEYLAGWQRARADFLNYKKEETERISGLMLYIMEEFILKILPVIDNLEIAEKNLPEDIKVNEHVKGLLQAKKQLKDFLKSQGVEEIEVLGRKFDPNWQEAVGEITGEMDAKGKESGQIAEEVQKGYKINGRLLRPAKVRIAK